MIAYYDVTLTNLIPDFDIPTATTLAAPSIGKGTGGVGEKMVAPPRGGVSLVGKVAKCPCLFISPQAKASLAYANASGEWLAANREALLYTAEPPFAFDTVQLGFFTFFVAIVVFLIFFHFSVDSQRSFGYFGLTPLHTWPTADKQWWKRR